MTPLLRLPLLRFPGGCSHLLALVIGALPACVQADEPALPVPFSLEQLSQAPAVEPAEVCQVEGVQAIFYEGVKYKGQPTRVFAYRGYPEGASAEHPVPAMVLIHGGGGTAFDRWVKVWNSRGYAAIAMDLCGCLPERDENNRWKRNERGGPPGWDASFSQIDEPVEDQWGWHAVSAAVLAHSLLRSDERVDANRIGVTGISWGGYLTSIVAGVDSRFQCAIPVYGCGFLADNSAWLPRFEQLGPEKAALWVKQWDPSSYLRHARMPVLWVNGTNDFAYPMDSWQKSYRLPPTPRTLCLRIRMPHGHGPAGENPEEIHIFANQHCRQQPGLARITQQGVDGQRAWATFATPAMDSPVPVIKAELCYTKATGRWQDRLWESLPADLDASGKRISAEVPPDATVFYLNLFDNRNCVVSTEHVDREAAAK